MLIASHYIPYVDESCPLQVSEDQHGGNENRADRNAGGYGTGQIPE